jgi:hypothetical protein
MRSMRSTNYTNTLIVVATDFSREQGIISPKKIADRCTNEI